MRAFITAALTGLIAFTSVLAAPLVKGPVVVFVSIPPLQYLTEKVGGSQLEVRTLVGPGQSPATYEPGPKIMAELAQAKLLVRTGVPFEKAWIGKIQAAHPTLKIWDARTDLPLRKMRSHDHGSHPHDALDPHFWTHPLLFKQAALNLVDVLTELIPEQRTTFEKNAQVLGQQLDALDQEIRQLLVGLANRDLMVYHPSWGYFTDAYGLHQQAIETEGKSPGARGLAKLLDQLRQSGIKTLFVQPQFNQQHAHALAGEIGGKVVVIDPLAYDYLNNLRLTATLISEAGQ